MERRKVRDEADARRALAAVELAGGRIGVWARANGIDGRSLRMWKLNLARRSAAQTGSARGPVSLVELVPTAPVAPARYMLRSGGLAFEFGDEVREETLRRVVAVLRAC
ncbi:MAG: hypothetical protein RL199_1642 [Pseudomonadota bacterium]|jgi:hypothetical protein